MIQSDVPRLQVNPSPLWTAHSAVGQGHGFAQGWLVDRPEQKFKRARRVFLREAHGELSRIGIRRSGALKPEDPPTRGLEILVARLTFCLYFARRKTE
jgi:hypothetical protein